MKLIKQRIPPQILATTLNKPGIRIDSAKLITAAEHFKIVDPHNSLMIKKICYPYFEDEQFAKYMGSPDTRLKSMDTEQAPDMAISCHCEKDYCEYVLDLKVLLTEEKLHEILYAQAFQDGVKRPEDYSINELLKIIKGKINDRGK